VVRALRRAFAGRTVLIVIDEAQQLSIPALETVRELLDEPPHCGLLVLGSHELRREFTINAVELEQWNSRIAGFGTLDGLSEAEAREILADAFGKLPENAVRETLKDCQASHLSRDGRRRSERYISARRLFNAIEDTQAEAAEEDSVQ
jgi:DNA transposition AAA+ family ATPase